MPFIMRDSGFCLDRNVPIASAQNLRKHYGKLEAVAGIDFAIEAGECFGFLGPNGAGKTTTMRMLYRASCPTSGELSLFGLDGSNGNHDRAIKAGMGVVPQEDNLDQELTVSENLEVFCRFFGVRGQARREKISELLGFFGLEDKADAKVITLSGGMKRRTLIARALVGSPQVLILDEPTTGLDPQARRAVWDRLLALRRQHNTTLVLTTHYMAEAEQLCDRLVIMDQGKIVAEGTPQALIDEHVQPYVVEVRAPERDFSAGDLPAGAKQLAAEAERMEVTPSRLLYYTADGKALIASAAVALPGYTTLLHQATLEDVFLTLTGRTLDA